MKTQIVDSTPYRATFRDMQVSGKSLHVKFHGPFELEVFREGKHWCARFVKGTRILGMRSITREESQAAVGLMFEEQVSEWVAYVPEEVKS